MSAPRDPGGPADGGGDPVASGANTTAGSGPSVATVQDGMSDGRRRGWRLPATELSVPVLRRGLSDFLRDATLSDDERYDLLLAACEAASNAIEHAGDPREPFFDVLATIGDAVTITVCDQGQWRDAPSGVHRGRGMAMMRILADATIHAGVHGTTVTLRSRRPAQREPVHA
jgi:anti-sigma regulatory factor (Ser/Thr protein kinase)